MNWLKHLFTRPSLLQVAAKELAEAEHSLLIAHSGIEWAQSSADYNQARITRLRAYISEGTTS